MNDITFIKGQGGLARALPAEDHISGILYYAASDAELPTDWDDGETKLVTDIYDLEAKNVLATTADFESLHYHVREYFRITPGAGLYVCIKLLPAEDGDPDFTEITDMQAYAEGKIRQVGVYAPVATTTTFISAIQAILEDLEDEHKPCSALIAWYTEDTITISALSDLRALSAEKVSVIIGQDGDADGAELFEALGGSVTCLGAALGAVSKASVHENIGWVAKFDMAEVELEMPALADGTLIKEVSEANQDTLNTKGYIFLRKHVGIAGSYFNDTHTCVAATSDYAYIEASRTIDKAIRGVRTYLLPELNGPVTVDASSGKLSRDYCSYLEAKGGQALAQMQRNGELSGYQVFVDPDQNVLSTSKVAVKIALVPKGVSRTIEVTIGFTTSLE